MLAVLYAAAALVALTVLVGFYQKTTNAMCNSKKRLDGKTVVVTGGTAGMGLRIAVELAARGATVIVGSPYAHEGAAAVRAARARCPGATLLYRRLELASLRSVRAFAAAVRRRGRLHVLVNNAGVGPVSDCLTEDGVNFVMQVNYLGHFLLTLLLLPLLLETGQSSEPSRIVNTASVLYKLGGIDVGDGELHAPRRRRPLQVYADSKLALVLFTRELARRTRGAGVVAHAVDPGAVGTDIFSCIGPVAGAFVKFLFRNVFKTPWQGAQTALHAALDERAGELSGALYKNCRPVPVSPRAGSAELAARLWEQSARLARLRAEELAAASPSARTSDDARGLTNKC